MSEGEPRSTRWTKARVTGLLSGLGAVAGAAAGAILTFAGNLISGYSIPPGFEIYLSNSAIIGVICALLAPPIGWSMLRSVPLWRAMLEPAAAGLLAGVLSMLFAPGLFVAAVPAGVILGAARLGVTHQGATSSPIPTPASRGALPTSDGRGV